MALITRHRLISLLRYRWVILAGIIEASRSQCLNSLVERVDDSFFTMNTSVFSGKLLWMTFHKKKRRS